MKFHAATDAVAQIIVLEKQPVFAPQAPSIAGSTS